MSLETVTSAVDWAISQLKPVTSTAQLEAEVLLAFVLGVQERPLIYGKKQLSNSQSSFFQNLIQRRSQGEPVAYLMGIKEFYSFAFQVDPRVLIPRNDTEGLVDEAAVFIEQHPTVKKILDVGVGSGALLVSILSQCKRQSLMGVGCDVSLGALLVARLNAQRLLGPEFNADVHPELMFTSPEEALHRGPYDVVVANPPYCSFEAWINTPRDVHIYEPAQALCTDLSLGEWLDQLSAYLSPRGTLFLEWGVLPAEGTHLVRMLGDHGFLLQKLIHCQPRCHFLILEKS